MLSLLLATALLVQDNPPKPPPLPGARETTQPAAPAQKPLVPGALPENTGAEERVLWQALCAGALAKGATRTPISAFDLWLDVTINSSANQTNEATTLRYRYQAPDKLRAMTEHGYELVRGPKGDLLIDPKRNQKGEALAVGREGDEDRRTLEEILDLARNFVALSDPGALRIAEMKLGRVEATLLPEELRASAGELKWLEIRTPDFRLPRTSTQTASAPGGLVRVRLGLRKDKPLPELCIVSGEQPGAQLSTLIRVPEYREKQGLMVPWQLRIHGLDESGASFQPKPALVIYLKKDSDLHPSFAPDTFAP